MARKKEPQPELIPLANFIQEILDVTGIETPHYLKSAYPESEFSSDTMRDALSRKTKPAIDTLRKFAAVLFLALKDGRKHTLKPEYASAEVIFDHLCDLLKSVDLPRQDNKGTPERLGPKQVSDWLKHHFYRLSDLDQGVVVSEILHMLDVTSKKWIRHVDDSFEDLDLSAFIGAVDQAMDLAGADTIEEYAYYLAGQGKISMKDPKIEFLKSGLQSILEGHLPEEESEDYAIVMRLLAGDICDGIFRGDPAAMINGLVCGVEVEA